jgi:hypothetical protein
MTAEADSGQSSFEQVRERLAELWSYLTANQTRLINYGREYREGHRISTAHVESTVDQLVDWRMEKKQHMRWTGRGAQMLLHARCALLNGELGTYTRWSPSESFLRPRNSVLDTQLFMSSRITPLGAIHTPTLYSRTKHSVEFRVFSPPACRAQRIALPYFLADDERRGDTGAATDFA